MATLTEDITTIESSMTKLQLAPWSIGAVNGYENLLRLYQQKMVLMAVVDRPGVENTLRLHNVNLIKTEAQMNVLFEAAQQYGLPAVWPAALAERIDVEQYQVFQLLDKIEVLNKVLAMEFVSPGGSHAST